MDPQYCSAYTLRPPLDLRYAGTVLCTPSTADRPHRRVTQRPDLRLGEGWDAHHIVVHVRLHSGEPGLHATPLAHVLRGAQGVSLRRCSQGKRGRDPSVRQTPADRPYAPQCWSRCGASRRALEGHTDTHSKTLSEYHTSPKSYRPQLPTQRDESRGGVLLGGARRTNTHFVSLCLLLSLCVRVCGDCVATVSLSHCNSLPALSLY